MLTEYLSELFTRTNNTHLPKQEKSVMTLCNKKKGNNNKYYNNRCVTHRSSSYRSSITTVDRL